ncbi:exo-beta-1,4-galactosidase [Leeuwenhoekiella nanhaiensis]|uniref:beta-galactosidase n=1 Tax=Leeuwenhoekiella nanhaiensis TaxID=1655491 RepID=A0A2G1VNU7_9FLAO|nr:sugar-binding domain-containing protein [Leeuwenhoekiella nanhaiensis]PHQ28149.1 beta-glucuronidase [Leeuwenhoekiella nanhaiensis]
MKMRILSLLLLAVSVSAFAQTRDTLDLEGTWHFQIDREDQGEIEAWFSKKLKDNIILPGSMLTNNKGNDITIKTQWTGSIYDSSFYFNPRFKKYQQPGDIKFPFWLTPKKEYVGDAWYQKEINIPKNWKDRPVFLFLERAHTETVVWLDDQKLGMQNSMVAPHQYELPPELKPGKHTLTIRVDNRIKEINVGPDSHSLTDHTQGNWNGIIGKLKLITTPSIYMGNIQAYPNRERAEVTFKIPVNQLEVRNSKVSLSLQLYTFNTAEKQKLAPLTQSFRLNKQTDTLQITANLGNTIQLWDEFDPALYRADFRLKSKKGTDQQQVEFGVRDFKAEGRSFTINNRPVFLRGTLDNAIFPLTGYPPMDVPAWERIFKIIKNHGLNHVRYHSWCPPEAAFKAADRLGIYLQPEGPSWANHGTALGVGRNIDRYIYEETNRMMQQYGNYASYVMMAYGNEPRGKQVEYLTAFNDYWKQKDTRRLYTGASVGGSWPVIPNNEFMVRGGARDLDWKNRAPQSVTDFSENIKDFNVPFVSHETGQYCVFPNFNEIEKYTGAYEAKNFELFQEDLADHHMRDQADAFFKASGKLQVLAYKYSIEKAMRTPGYSGYQLLSLNDYSGQGTALVGILDAFWDPKPYVNAEEWREFSSETVPLAEFPKFVFTNIETLTAEILIAHYGVDQLQNSISWQLTDSAGAVLTTGTFDQGKIDYGLSALGSVKFPLREITEAQKLTLTVAVQDTEFKNHWDFWVFPESLPKVKSNVYECTVLDEKALQVLNEGGSVLLNAAGKIVKGAEVAQTFLPVFWNTSWFQMRAPHTLGFVVDPAHPLFKDFPTDSHSDLQWWSIVNKEQVMHLEDFPPDFKPLIQPIDTWFMNRRLAIAFEAKVGNGKLLMLSVDLNDPDKDAAAHQLYYSLKTYMNSPEFNPQTQLDAALIQDLLTSPSRQQFDKYTKDSPDELKPEHKGN